MALGSVHLRARLDRCEDVRPLLAGAAIRQCSRHCCGNVCTAFIGTIGNGTSQLQGEAEPHKPCYTILQCSPLTQVVILILEETFMARNTGSACCDHVRIPLPFLCVRCKPMPQIAILYKCNGNTSLVSQLVRLLRQH